MPTWNEDWPILGVQDHDGGKRLKLSCAALYWSVKQMINDLARDPEIIGAATSAHSSSSAAQLSLCERICILLRAT